MSPVGSHVWEFGRDFRNVRESVQESAAPGVCVRHAETGRTQSRRHKGCRERLREIFGHWQDDDLVSSGDRHQVQHSVPVEETQRRQCECEAYFEMFCKFPLKESLKMVHLSACFWANIFL